MEVQSMDKEEVAREKGIYHVTVVGERGELPAASVQVLCRHHGA